MIKRVLAGLAAVAAFGVLAAPAAQAEGPAGKPGCIWVWTSKGPACHWQ